MSEDKSFRESRLYPVVFIFVLTMILTAILAFAYEASRQKVEEYRQLTLKRSIISLFKDKIVELKDKNLSEMNLKDINHIYDKNFTRKELNPDSEDYYYEFSMNDSVMAYCYNIEFGGLWGPISILAAVEKSHSRLIGIKILQQNETPGLGARIEEDWFQKQFSGKKFRQNDQYTSWQLVSEDASARENQIRQVSGATFSSKAVIDGLLKQLRKLQPENREKSDD